MRTLLLALFLFAISTPGLAQNKYEGKWATGRPQPADPLTDNGKGAGPAQIEIIVVGANAANDLAVKGSLSLGGLGGNFYTFDKVTVSRNKIYFQVTVAQSTYSTWYAQLVDDNTLTVWSHGLDLVGNNVLDLIKLLPGAQFQQSAPAAVPAATQPAAQTVQGVQLANATPTANDSAPSCGAQGAPFLCYVLHRAK